VSCPAPSCAMDRLPTVCQDDPTCPAGGTFLLSRRPIWQAWTPNCSSTGTCPLGPGANPAVMQILQQYPLPNMPATFRQAIFRGIRFPPRCRRRLDTYVAKLDYNLTPNGNHQVFVRGGLMADRGAAPGDPTSATGSGGSEFPGPAAQRHPSQQHQGIHRRPTRQCCARIFSTAFIMVTFGRDS